MADSLLGKSIISLLKYKYASNPSEKSLYSDLANKTRQMFNIQDYGAEQQLDPTFNPQSMDWTEAQSLIKDWLGSGNQSLISYANSLSSVLGISAPVNAQPYLEFQAAMKQQPAESVSGLSPEEIKMYQEYQTARKGETPISPTEPVTPVEQAGIDYATSKFNVYENQLNAEETKARNDLLAQQAQYQSLLGNNWVNGVLTQLGQLQAASIDSVNQMAELAKQSVTAQASASRTQVNADYIGVIDEIKQAANEARQMKNEDLNARGMYFSSVLTDALDKISVSEIQTIGKTEGQRVAKLAQIATNLVTATANIDIDTIKSNANITTQYGLQKLALISQDAKDKAGYESILAGLEVSTKGVTDYYKTLKEGLPAMKAIINYEVLTPIKSAEAEAQYKEAQDAFDNNMKTLDAQRADGYLTAAQYNAETGRQNSDLAYAKYNAEQDPYSFANLLETRKVVVSEGNLTITTKVDEARIKEIDANIKNTNADTWRVLHPISSETATGTMSFTDAKSLLALQMSLTKTAAGGTDNWGNPATTESQELAKQQLVLYGSSFLMAQARIIAEDDPEQANAIIATQQYMYQQFGTTSDYDLDQYSVKKLYEDKISLDKYPKAKTIIETWISGLPGILPSATGSVGVGGG